METMYDRLGDLLSETLETGHVKFVKKKPEERQNPEEKKSDSPEEKSKNSREDNYVKNKKAYSEKSRKYAGAHRNGYGGHINSGTVIKAFPEELNRAYRLLGITVSATKEDVKKAYKEKLQYYHPDKHTGNPILEKVATDKTRQVVEAYNKIIKYLEELER